MKLSMNGFRTQISGDVQALRDIVKAVIDGDFYDREDLQEAMNDVIRHSNVLNCVYSKDDPDFTDMSHVEVEPIGEESD